ncbi:hypothetical protein GCM10022239_04690 [Leifsonia bigeumensis]|uniref:Uncharacterized protein n=1 Tax=Leifsonella bigeumensis TaxID=433643 RepID=A0ABP7F462_9MICO
MDGVESGVHLRAQAADLSTEIVRVTTVRVAVRKASRIASAVQTCGSVMLISILVED